MRKWQPQGFVPRIAPHRDQSLIPCIFLADPSKLDPVKWIKLVDFLQRYPHEILLNSPWFTAISPSNDSPVVVFRTWPGSLGATAVRQHRSDQSDGLEPPGPDPTKWAFNPQECDNVDLIQHVDTFGIWTHLDTIKHHQTMEFATQRHFRCSADWFQGKSTGNLAFCSPQIEGCWARLHGKAIDGQHKAAPHDSHGRPWRPFGGAKDLTRWVLQVLQVVTSVYCG